MKIKNLTPDTIKRIQTNPKLFNIFLEENPGFIEKIILKFTRHDSADFDDYYQIGCVALWRALDKFNAERMGASTFSTYAHHVIFNDALQEVKRFNSRSKAEVPIETLRAMYDGELSNEYNEKLFEETSQIYMCRNFESIIVNKMLVHDKVKQFNELERKVFQYKIIDKLSLRETAEKIGINQHTLKQLFYKKIVKKFRELGDEILAN